MKAYILILILIAVGYQPSKVEAQDLWGASAKEHIQSFDTPYKNTYLSTVMGACDFPKAKLSRIRGDVDKLKIRPHNFKKKIPYLQVIQVDNYDQATRDPLNPDYVPEKFHHVPAPLMIYIPGAFSEYKTRNSKFFSDFFNKRGFHVVALTNPWSKEFIKGNAPYIPGNIEEEAKTTYEVIRTIVAKLNKKKLIKNREIHVLGVSYGAFLSSMIAAFDSQHDNPILTKGRITLFSPPYDFGRTMNRFDELGAELSNTMTNFYVYNLIYRYKRICYHRKVTKRLLRNAKLISLYGGFKRNLVISLKKFLRVHDIDQLPLNSQNWKDELTFEGYYQWFDPSLADWLKSEKGKFLYWYDTALSSGNYEIRVLAANDDFLNDSSVWNTRNYENILTVPHGGHFGFSGLEWFKQLMNKIY